MFKSSIWTSGLTIIVSIVSFASQVLIAKFFGAKIEVDSYLAIISIPTLVAALFSSGINYVLTPELVRIKTKSPNLHRYYGILILKQFARYAFVGSIMLFLFLLVFRNFIFQNTMNIKSSTIYILIFLSCLTSFFTILLSINYSLLNSDSKFRTPILLSLIPYLCTIVTTYIFNNSLGVISISLGTAIGFIIAFSTSLTYLNESSNSFRLNSLKLKVSNEYNSIFKSIFVASISMLCFSIYQPIDAYWAPRLGESNLSYLGYGQRLIIAMGSLIIAGPFTVLVPSLTKAYEDNSMVLLNYYLLFTLKVIYFIGLYIVLEVSLFGGFLIKLLFERGEFALRDTIAVSKILPYLSVGMVFMLCTAINIRVIFIKKNQKFAILLGILSIVLYFFLSGLGSGIWGILGISFAYILTWFILFIVSTILILNTELKQTEIKRHLQDAIKLLPLFLLLAYMFNTLNIIVIIRQMNMAYQFFTICIISVTILFTYVYLFIKVWPIIEIVKLKELILNIFY